MSTSLARLGIALLLLCAGCATTGATPASNDPFDEPSSRRSLAEDVVLVGGFGRVAAVAVSSTHAFVAGDGGVAIYDRLRSRWLSPIPLLNARELLIDRRGAGVYVNAGAWWSISTSGFVLPLPPRQLPARDDVVLPPSAQQIMRDTPGLQSFGALLTRDAQLRTWQLTALARAPERSEIWAGTNGGGVFVVDPMFLRSTQLPYGMRNRGATALALASDGVWIVEEPDVVMPDLAITFAAEDLTTWRWLSPAHGAYVVAALALRGHFACMATTVGPIIVDLDSPTQTATRVSAFTQLGDPISAWSTAAGCWVGGTTGFARLPWPADSATRSSSLSNDGAAFAFASSGDTTWIATMSGVRLHLSDHTADGGAAVGSETRAALSDAPSGALPNALRGPIRALALAGDGLALVTDRELWLTTGTARLSTAVRVDSPIDRLGRIRRVAGDDKTLWLAGSRGAAAFSLRDHRWRFVMQPGAAGAASIDLDRAGDVRDVALSPHVAWLATAAGVIRVARGTDGMPR